MTPKQAINQLTNQNNLSQPDIVRLLSDKGVKTTQETISRIGTGKHKNPKYVLGQAIVDLAKRMKPVSQKEVA